MSGLEVPGLISAAIEGVKLNRKIYETIKDTKDLPDAFHEVNTQLALIQSTLEAAQKAAQDAVNAGNNSFANELVSIVATITSCNKKVEELKLIFSKARELHEDRHSFRKRYRAMVESFGGTTHRVEALTRDMLDDLLSLRANRVFHLAIKDQVDNINQALEALNLVEASVEEGIPEAGNLLVHSGSYNKFSDGDIRNVHSIWKLEDRQDYANNNPNDINTNERIESEKNAEPWEARPAQNLWCITIFDRRNSVYRFMKCQVDTGSSINCLTREIAIDHGLEIQSLGSEPSLYQTLTGEELALNEYVNLTLVSEVCEPGRARQYVETVFYVLPSDIPSDSPSLTEPVIGYHLSQKLMNVSIDLIRPTMMSTENAYLKEKSQEEARMVEADDTNSSFDGQDRIWAPPDASDEIDSLQTGAQALTVEPQESYQTNTPVAKDTAEPYASTILSSDPSLGSSRPTQIFSAAHSISTKPTAPSQAGTNEGNPHFSGYDDTTTNYTSPWKEHPHSKALIRGLAQHLNEEAKSFSRDEGVLDRISAALPDLVRAFALRLGYSPRTTDDRDVALFLRRNRLLIGDAFSLDEMEPEDLQHDSELERIKAQRMEQWQSQVKSHDPADIEVSNHRDDDDLSKKAIDIDEIDDTDDIAPQEIAKYRKIITGSAQYSWLLADMRRLCILTPGSPEDLMEKVRDTVRTALPRNIPISKHGPMPGCQVTFEIPWDPCGFWQKENFREKITRGLENAITITGSAEDAQATTAGEYLTQTWPVTAKHAMKLVKELVSGLEIPRTASESLPDGTSMYAQMEGGRLRITAIGAEDTIVEVGQQFIWLAAALRSSPHDDCVTACLPTIGRAPGPSSSFPAISVYFTFEKIASGKQGMERAPGFCWQDMFRNPVIVGGFPILKKPSHGLGLEMPLRLMAALAGSERLSEFSGRTYIKGYSAMVVATAVLTNTVVWHYCYHKQGGRIAYGDHDLQSCPQVSMQQLTTSRHIVGWCSTCKVYAGAADALYESIGPSDADSPSSGMILDRINLSFGHFGVGGGASVAMCTRVKPKHYRPKDYVGMIEWVKTTYVVMWDEETKTGWLVNGSNAILHLARAKLHAWHNNRIYAKLLLIKPEELKDDGDRDPESAACTLLDQKNRRLKIWIASDEIKKTYGDDKSDGDEISSTYLLFADVVEELVDKFEILFDEQADKAGRNGINLRQPVRQHLEGWDFLDVLRGSEISPRQVTLGFGGWGWVNFARSINVVTLIGRRFGQLIRPAQSDELCTEWQSVKRNKSYLAASIFDLKEIRRDKPSKISHLLWHSPQNPFAKCLRCVGFDQQGESVVTRASNDTKEHHVPVQTFWPTQMPSCVKKLKERQYLKQVHSDGGAVIFENLVTPWFSWAAGADLNEGNPSTPVPQPKNSANEDIDAEKSHMDTQNLPRRVKQKFSHFFHPSPPQQSGGESTTDTRGGSASVSEDAGQGQIPGSVNTPDTSLASEPAQDCQYAEEIAQKRRKLDNSTYK